VKLDFPFLVVDTDRHGNDRVYVRRSGRKIRVREPMGSQAFYVAYAAARERLSNVRAPKDANAPKGFPRGTLGWLGACYFASAEFQSMEPHTQRTVRAVLESCFREPHTDSDPEPMGNCPLQHFTAHKVKRLRDLKAGKPAAANARRKWLGAMFSWAIEQTPPLAASNPARETKPVKHVTDGFHTWTAEEIATFEKRHPIGTRARLALALLLYTGARRSDVVRFGPANVVNGWLRFTPQKTKKKRPEASEKPWLPVLADIVARSPCGSQTFLQTSYGKPFTAAGFGIWFRERCDEAGLPQCTAHGLRKAGAVLAAENGATINQLMAVFDWLSPIMAKRYTDRADKRRMTEQAMGLLAIAR
jgi:integrase